MIQSQLEQVREFHRAFGLVINDEPLIHDNSELLRLRETLVREEYREFMKALVGMSPSTERTILLADAMADLIYVILGTAVSYGIPLDDVFVEVQKSNMSKLGEDGKPITREDGKILKGPNFKEPELAPILWPVPHNAW